MRELAPSLKIYVILVITLALLAAINVFLPQNGFLPLQELPAPKPVLALVNAAVMLILYGGLGLIGLKLAHKLGFADLWDANVTNRERFVIPAVIGVGIGILFIIADAVLSPFHTLGPFPHPPFPTSLVASAVAGIGEELLFRLVFISFGVWLISYVILRNIWQIRYSGLARLYPHLHSLQGIYLQL
jgi:hypothetical protein